jgi:hypothetical protein
MFKWLRNPLAEPGARQGQLLVSIAVPTNHLSTYVKDVYQGVHWIAPAKPGRGIMLRVLLTREPEAYVREIYGPSGNGALVHQAIVEGDARVCLLADNFDCGPVDIKVPGEPRKPGQVFGDLMFPERDLHNTGRPVRILFAPEKTMPPTMWDLGGYKSETVGKIEQAALMITRRQ